MVRRDFIKEAGARLKDLHLELAEVLRREGDAGPWLAAQWDSGDLIAQFYVACVLWTRETGWQSMERWYGLRDAQVRHEFALLHGRAMPPETVKEIVKKAAAVIAECGYEHTPLSYDELLKMAP